MFLLTAPFIERPSKIVIGYRKRANTLSRGCENRITKCGGYPSLPHFGLPSCFPSFRARLMPIWTRSLIRLRSNSATAPNTAKIIFPRLGTYAHVMYLGT
jgi:hypothetical protein